MPLFVTVTPGTTVTSSTTLDASTLNLLGTPSVDVTGTVDGGSLSISAGSVPLTSLVSQANATLVGNGSGVSASPVALDASADFSFTSSTFQIKSAAITATKIASSAVEYAKIQNVADARLLGRSAGSAGVVQELTVGSGLTLSGGTLSSGILRYTTTAKDIPVIGNTSQLVQWLTSASELPSSSVTPQLIRVVLACKTNDGSFVVGNELDIASVIVEQTWNSGNLTNSYNLGVASGIVSASNLFLNVYFSKARPGNRTNSIPANTGGDADSQLVYLDFSGSRTVLTRANWQVKAYLMYASTWA
ncbi:hypothetical protein UFOVP175_40 [uncultured Caudovirales phage]|uniref:Uncharacterized protein n=1 Tax=uncultured Caudovirales phage TaxID=2100421 RepID=A0A6J7WCP8_9CAUD|nr:hypothetical protein UFOVP175_40 [uncultured Caudovirales phage]